MVGDLANGRTVHSLAYLLASRKNVRMWLVAPEVVRMRKDILTFLKGKWPSAVPFSVIRAFMVYTVVAKHGCRGENEVTKLSTTYQNGHR